MTLERHPGEWEHDAEVGAWYFYLDDSAGQNSRTIEGEDPIVNVDVAEDGRIIGIEVIVTLPPEVSPKEETADADR